MAISPKGTLGSLQWAILAQNVLTFMVPAFLTAAIINKRPFAFIDADSLPSWKAFGYALIIYVCAIPSLNFIIWLNENMSLPGCLSGVEQWMRQMEDALESTTKQLMAIDSIGQLLLTILLVGVITGVGEEMFFRGALQNILLSKPMNKHIAVWIVAIVFSAIHFQFFGFVPRLLVGAFFGYLVIWSGSLWLAALMHAINNSLTVIFNYAKHQGCDSVAWLEDIGSPDCMPFCALASAIIVLALFYYLKDKSWR